MVQADDGSLDRELSALSQAKRRVLVIAGVVPCLLSPLVLVMLILRGDAPQKALGAACWEGDLLRARVALFCGAEIDKHLGGSFPNIGAAGYKGHVQVIEFLLARGADIETKDKFHGTALSRAAQNGQLAAVEYLLARGADPNVKDDEGGNTPLDLAAMHYRKETSGKFPAPTDAAYEGIIKALQKAGGHRRD